MLLTPLNLLIATGMLGIVGLTDFMRYGDNFSLGSFFSHARPPSHVGFLATYRNVSPQEDNISLFSGAAKEGGPILVPTLVIRTNGDGAIATTLMSADAIVKAAMKFGPVVNSDAETSVDTQVNL